MTHLNVCLFVVDPGDRFRYPPSILAFVVSPLVRLNPCVPDAHLGARVLPFNCGRAFSN